MPLTHLLIACYRISSSTRIFYAAERKLGWKHLLWCLPALSPFVGAHWHLLDPRLVCALTDRFWSSSGYFTCEVHDLSVFARLLLLTKSVAESTSLQSGSKKLLNVQLLINELLSLVLKIKNKQKQTKLVLLFSFIFARENRHHRSYVHGKMWIIHNLLFSSRCGGAFGILALCQYNICETHRRQASGLSWAAEFRCSPRLLTVWKLISSFFFFFFFLQMGNATAAALLAA